MSSTATGEPGQTATGQPNCGRRNPRALARTVTDFPDESEVVCVRRVESVPEHVSSDPGQRTTSARYTARLGRGLLTPRRSNRDLQGACGRPGQPLGSHSR